MTDRKIDEGGMFFPIKDDGWNPGMNGITRRDWPAGLAMQGLAVGTFKGYGLDALAGDAYKMADAIIAEGRKGGE